jgi:hypothetical protein
MMEAKLFSEFFEIPARRISNIGPDDIAFDLSQVADVSRETFFSKLSGVTV